MMLLTMLLMFSVCVVAEVIIDVVCSSLKEGSGLLWWRVRLGWTPHLGSSQLMKMSVVVVSTDQIVFGGACIGSLPSSNRTDQRLKGSAALGVDAAASDKPAMATAVSTMALS